MMYLLFVVILFSSNYARGDNAMQTCGNLHQFEFKSIPNAAAAFSNSNCMLKCSIGDKVLSNDALNENFPCPLNPKGVCHKGICVESKDHRDIDALRECSNFFPTIDFKNGQNKNATYSNDKCFLKCEVNGEVISAYPMNEGYACPMNAKGVCRGGHCKVDPDTTYNPLRAIKEIDITISDGNFFDKHASSYVSVCVQNVTQMQFDRSHCQQFTATRMTSNQQSKHQNWQQTLKISGPFDLKSFLLINLWDGSVTPHKQIGHYGETLKEIYLIHLPTFRDRSRDKFFSHPYSLINEKYYIGDVIAQFKFLYA